MNPSRWRPLHANLPSLDRVADCWFHGVNVECPHSSKEACEAMQQASVGFIISGVERSSPRQLLELNAANAAWRGGT